jgi:hypothetical protein
MPSKRVWKRAQRVERLVSARKEFSLGDALNRIEIIDAYVDTFGTLQDGLGIVETHV